jgi:hypothetical protein
MRIRTNGVGSSDDRPLGAYWWRIFCARMRRRMRFLRHFQRMWPRFFQTRELRFILGRPKWGAGSGLRL